MCAPGTARAIGRPTDPTRAGGYNTSGFAWGVAVSGGYAYVADGYGGLQILHVNFTPSASIDSISPSPADEGEVVSFSGSGTDSSGSIVAYQWRSDIDGPLSTSVSFSNSSLSVGDHTIYLKVQDNDGEWSREVNQSLHINALPTATIDTISPSPADEGNEVSFSGSGSDNDGTVVGYEWRSNIDGNLSTEASFSTSSLAPGEHTISFRVQDNDGAWSEWDTETLVITPESDDSNGISALVNDIPTNVLYGALGLVVVLIIVALRRR